MTRLNWKKIINIDVQQALDFYTSQGSVLGLRTVHYRLFSLGVIPDTRSCYTQLSHKTARAREWGSRCVDAPFILKFAEFKIFNQRRLNIILNTNTNKINKIDPKLILNTFLSLEEDERNKLMVCLKEALFLNPNRENILKNIPANLAKVILN
jgi:hypothetical protein